MPVAAEFPLRMSRYDKPYFAFPDYERLSPALRERLSQPVFASRSAELSATTKKLYPSPLIEKLLTYFFCVGLIAIAFVVLPGFNRAWNAIVPLILLAIGGALFWRRSQVPKRMLKFEKEIIAHLQLYTLEDDSSQNVRWKLKKQHQSTLLRTQISYKIRVYLWRYGDLDDVDPLPLYEREEGPPEYGLPAYNLVVINIKDNEEEEDSNGDLGTRHLSSHTSGSQMRDSDQQDVIEVIPPQHSSSSSLKQAASQSPSTNAGFVQSVLSGNGRNHSVPGPSVVQSNASERNESESVKEEDPPVTEPSDDSQTPEVTEVEKADKGKDAITVTQGEDTATEQASSDVEYQHNDQQPSGSSEGSHVVTS